VSHCETAQLGARGRLVQDLGEKTVRLRSPIPRGVVAVPRPTATGSHVQGRRRRQLSHDIRHELGTVMMLASLLVDGDDVGPEGRRQASQLLEEARWLVELQNAYQDSSAADEPAASPSPEPVRLDLCARQTVAALGLSSPTTIDLLTSEVWAEADKLALWRALRNVLGNAIRAAGPAGRVAIRVGHSGRWAVAQIDDDGPGFGATCSGIASMGLDIVNESIAACGGQLQIRRSSLGGYCVRLLTQAIAAPNRANHGFMPMSDEFRGLNAVADL
jgi:signal transduction histidine kinase